MTQEEDLRQVLDLLEHAGAAYALVGSTASSRWGRPRTTQDADVVCALVPDVLEAILPALASRHYVPEDIAREAVRGLGGPGAPAMFNLIERETAFKIDLIVRPPSDPVLARRVASELLGRPAWFASPEDTVVAKLAWHRESGSDLQVRDAAGILQVQRGRLDLAYLRDAAGRRNVLDLLEQLLAETAGAG